MNIQDLMPTGKYSLPDRLPDVLALIQVLALDEHTHRSEEGLSSELQGQPQSAPSWGELAQQHPEFFRVRLRGEHGVSLIARHVLPRNENGVRELPVELTGKLMDAAINMYDREMSRRDRARNVIPIVVAILAAAATIGAALLRS